MNENELERLDRMMAERDNSFLLNDESKRLNLLSLADEVPGLVSEVRAFTQKLETVTRAARNTEERLREQGDALARKLQAAELQVGEAKERYAKVVESFDTFYWSDEQRNVVRIIAEAIRTGQPSSNWERSDITEKRNGRCGNCNHEEDEHKTPGGCVAAAIYCDCNSFRVKGA